MRAGIAGIVSVLVVAVAASGAFAASKPPSPRRQVAKAFSTLTKDTRKVPRRNVSKRHRRALLRTIRRAKHQARRRPCKAIKTLRRYNRRLRRVHEKRFRTRIPAGGSFRGQLQADVLRADVALLALPKSRRCGGGKRAKVTVASTKVVQSDERHLRLKLSFPAPTFAPHQVGGTEFQQMFMEGAGETGDDGKPGLPALTDYFGIPTGATASLKINKTRGYNLHGVNLFPHQPSPADLALPPGAPPISTFADKPFQVDSKFYKSKGKFPPTPADAQGLGGYRSLSLGGVDFAGGQYKPRTDTLHVFTSIDVTVTFGGDNKGTFGDGNDIGGHWSSYIQGNYRALVTNYDAIAKHAGPIHPVPACGHDMLIVTSPALAPAAETFRAAKQAQGYSPFVRTTAQIGTTNDQIASYIHSQLLEDCIVPLQYVVLLGNTAHVPTFLEPCGPGGNPAECNIASDLRYSLNPASLDLFADVELGRIPAIDLAGANAVVNKIINYENNPPAPPGDDFYHHATTTSYFQPAMHCVLNEGGSGTPNCDEDHPPVTGHWEIDHANHQDTRGFTKTAEAVNMAMRNNGYDVDRLYTTDDDDVIPERYYDGTSIPSHLRRPTFPWNSNTTDFLNAYNGGRFLILHRDHGWPDGWAAPTLESWNVPSLTNGTKLPVVFGINCASAAFDTPDHPSFVELQVEKPDGGAVAGFGDTRESPTWPNNNMTRGFFDALFPNLQPEYGSPTPTRRLGDVLVRGKQFMASQEGAYGQGAGGTYVEHYLYGLLGDPSMQMWADAPHTFDPRRILSELRAIGTVNPGDPNFEVNIRFPIGGGDPPPLGTVATLFHNGDAIGRGVVGGDGTLTIRPDIKTSPRNLTVSFQQDGTLPAQDDVEKQSPKEKTSLTLNDPGSVSETDNPNTFTGSISPALAGAKIRVVYTPHSSLNPNGTIQHTVTADGSGNWQDQVSFTYYQTDDRWQAQAFFDGDADHASSASNIRSFAVND